METIFKSILTRIITYEIVYFYLGEIPQIKRGDYPDAMSYDANGRITRDTSRGITSVAYNRLGLPSQINLGANDRVATTYRSDGVKTQESNRHNYLATVIKVTTTGDTIYQQVKRSTITTRNYQGSLVRENGKPDRIYNEAGYIDIHPREDSVSYHYYIRDYLGSVRAVVDANGIIEQAADYHSGGIPSSEYGNFSADNRLHTGKEFNNFSGLAWYDNNARMYDPITTRFTTPDPLAEKYPDQSPYAHCANNPLKYVDPNGMEKVVYLDKNDPKNKLLINAANRYQNDNALQIFAHGTKENIKININGDNITYSKDKVKSFISFLSKNSETGKNLNSNSEKTIVLHSCNTGQGDGSFAESLSKALPKSTIIAPSGLVVVNAEGEKGVFDKQTKDPGQWKVFQNGQVTDRFSNIWKPTDNPSIIDKFNDMVKSGFNFLFK